MTLDEFESRYRNAIDEILNQLQTVTLLVAQAEDRIAEVGNSVQRLNLTVEEFIIEQKDE